MTLLPIQRVGVVSQALLLTAMLVPPAYGQGPSPSVKFASDRPGHGDEEFELQSGIVAYERGDYVRALAHLARISGDNAVAARYRALCHVALGDREAATAEVNAISTNAKVATATAARQEGQATVVSHLEANPQATAIDDEFASLVNDSLADKPVVYESEVSSYNTPNARGFGEKFQSNPRGPNGPPANRPWNFTLITGHQYDSNVSLTPDFSGLGAQTQQQDCSWFLASLGDYRLVQEPDKVVGLLMSTYDNFYFSQSQFDLQDYMGGAQANCAVGENWIAGVRYEFHNSYLDYEAFANEHRFVPNLTLKDGDRGHTTFYYEFDSADFNPSPLIPEQGRDGNVNAVGFTRALYTFGGLGRLFFGYRFQNADTDGSDFDCDTNMVTARIERPCGERWIFDAEVRQFWDDYENGNSLDFAGRPRSDQRTEVRVGIQRYCSGHLSLRLDYTYYYSNSNTVNLFDVAFFEYNRHLLATQIIYDF